MADANTDTNTNTETNANGDLISRAEAKKAFEARDKAKKELQALMDSGRVLSDDQWTQFQTLQDTAAKAEEERNRKAGEFDNWRNQITEKHTKELADRDKRFEQERSKRIKRTIDAAFGSLTSGANDFFSGNEGSKTVWDVWTAQHTLGQFIEVEDTEDGDERVIVKDPKGNRILGADGNPAPIAEAISELIKQLPNKDRILRGSGKTGSGSSGGSSGGREAIDLRNLTPEQRRDPKVLAMLRASQPRGSLVMGEAYQR
jgi:hypothetical protein